MDELIKFIKVANCFLIFVFIVLWSLSFVLYTFSYKASDSRNVLTVPTKVFSTYLCAHLHTLWEIYQEVTHPIIDTSQACITLKFLCDNLLKNKCILLILIVPIKYFKPYIHSLGIPLILVCDQFIHFLSLRSCHEPLIICATSWHPRSLSALFDPMCHM